MSNVAFIVHVDVQDLSSLADESAHIQDALENDGVAVISVAPWTRPTTQTPTNYTIPSIVPPPTEPPILS